jgi:hypothetical protein
LTGSEAESFRPVLTYEQIIGRKQKTNNIRLCLYHPFTDDNVQRNTPALFRIPRQLFDT